MLYENYIIDTHYIDFSELSSHTLTILGNDGTSRTITNLASGYTYGNMCNNFAKYCIDNTYNAWGYVYTTSTYNYLVITNSVDFVKLTNEGYEDGSVSVRAVELANNGNDESTQFGTDINYELYCGYMANTFSSQVDTDYPYGQVYTGNLSLDSSTYFDLSMCWCPSDSYYYNYQVKQYNYNNNPFYFYQQHLRFRKIDGAVGISYGFTNSHRDLAYSGYQDGYSDGYKAGYTAGSQVDTYSHNAFSYLEGAFNSIGGILALEILPHVTLGLCFSIPFTIGMISLIFRLVKK